MTNGRVEVFSMISPSLFCLVVLRPLYQVILLTKLNLLPSLPEADLDIYKALCQSVGPRLAVRMETMQEESDVLTSEEFANIEAEGLAMLARQLQVKFQMRQYL